VSQVSEGCAAIQGPSVALNGSSCAQLKARRIVALDGERASASGCASQNLRLKDKVTDAPQMIEECAAVKGLIAILDGSSAHRWKARRTTALDGDRDSAHDSACQELTCN
jgi:hypothetical protein